MPGKKLDDTLRQATGIELHPNNIETSSQIPGTEHDLQGYADKLDTDQAFVEPKLEGAGPSNPREAHDAEATLVKAMDFTSRGRTLVAHRMLHKLLADSSPDLSISEATLTRWHTKVVRAMTTKWGMTHVMSNDKLDNTLPPSLKKKSRSVKRNMSDE